MRLIDTNFCTESATTVTYSSQKASFPASNMKNPFRSKRWRSSGTFVIDSTNDKIDFNEGGSELTATLTTGTYTPSELATEIKTQLEAVGAATFTVSFSASTGLWTLVSDGATFELLNSTGTNAATSTLVISLGFPSSDKTAALTYTGSTIALHTEESLTFDLATTEDLNSVVVLWPREDGVRLSEDAVISIQANATDSWSSPAVDQVLTLNNDYSVASHFFSTDQSYRYWRLKIVDPGNANLHVEVGQLVIGKALSIQEPENGFGWQTIDQSKTQKNDYGHVYVDEYPNLRSIDMDFAYMEYEDVALLHESYNKNGTKHPVLVAIDADESVYDKDHFLIYGKYASSQETTHVLHKLFDATLSIVELG